VKVRIYTTRVNLNDNKESTMKKAAGEPGRGYGMCKVPRTRKNLLGCDAKRKSERVTRGMFSCKA
jgi:hypothetical protein